MNKKHITYLLGAGASANSIPIVNNMRGRLLEVVSFLKILKSEKVNSGAFDKYPLIIKNNQNIVEIFINQLEWLYEESYAHQTIDTLAKKYFLTDLSKLIQLKEALILYFTIEQILNLQSRPNENYTFVKKREYRYDSLLAALLFKDSSGKLMINSTLKILSWNYDHQIELALRNYTDDSVESIKKYFNIIPNDKSIVATDYKYFDVTKFGVIKLNGTAIWKTPRNNGSEINKSCFNHSSYSTNDIDKLTFIIEEYNEFLNERIPLNSLAETIQYFNFSWESIDSYTNKFKNYNDHQIQAFSIAENTEVLVIIGYSFPVFNRETDKKIINKMCNSLKKIYIQDPNCTEIKSLMLNGFEEIMKREIGGMPIEFILEKNTTQFIVPFELN